MVQSTLNAIIVYFSSTNNTRYIAEHIASALVDSNVDGKIISVRTYDGLKLFKSADLGNPNDLPQIDLTKIEIWSKFLNSLRTANILGFGCYVFASNPPPYILRILNESIIGQQYLQSIKQYFTFSTFGSLHSKVVDILAWHLNQRLINATFIGKIDFHCPENFPPLLPFMGEKDKWSKNEIVRLSQFEQKIIKRIYDQDFKGEKFATNKYSIEFQKKNKQWYGTISIDTNLCIKCGLCEKNCPYNAIKLKKIKDGVIIDNVNDSEIEKLIKVPIVDQQRCQQCSRCYNNCPTHAINYAQWETHLRSQYKGPQLKFNKASKDEQERIDIHGEQPVELDRLPYPPVLMWRMWRYQKSFFIYCALALIVICYIIYKLC
ncbi:MAG: hypothetical protein EZS28_036893 [Streblomastix strix]|uniref:4Fe-4S ferredoxin-type domain-containing protein n=1 Tax=Streblomastix strix TaxID=222440 RepID=A0A5J4UCE3_9EUKA|nr:MAG: hypothetical protein EZS28_036893 [Streblomastix strix]